VSWGTGRGVSRRLGVDGMGEGCGRRRWEHEAGGGGREKEEKERPFLFFGRENKET